MTGLPKNQMAIDRLTYDIGVDPETHQIRRVDGRDGIIEALRSRLLLIKGEWFLRTSQGIPWFTDLAGRNVPKERIRSILTAEILSTWGVEELESLDITHDAATRRVEVQFTYRDIYGNIVKERL